MNQLTYVASKEVDYIYIYCFLINLINNFLKQLYCKYAEQISPINCQYCTLVESVVNQLLMTNKDLHQVFSKTWTMVILNDQKTINALVLPVSFETIKIILLVFNFLLHFRMESSLYFLVC